MSPIERARLDARVWLSDRPSATPQDLFRERCRLFGREIYLWLKRVRVAEQRRRVTAVAPADFSYLLVAEKHQDGWPHWHMLLHEHAPSVLIHPDEIHVTAKGARRVADTAMVRTQWRFGFTQGELCTDHRSAGYLCKYLAKDMPWRVRASIGYGDSESSGFVLPPHNGEGRGGALRTLNSRSQVGEADERATAVGSERGGDSKPQGACSPSSREEGCYGNYD